MSKKTYSIREIQKKDNPEIAKVIREVLIEFGVPKIGTAYEDKALDTMFDTYNIDNAAYFVITDGQNILGCAGVMQLQNSKENICELQKMYFLQEIRGKGLGMKIIEICLLKAQEFGYQKCYLETLPYMTSAQKLYEKVGFKYLEMPIGNTEHYNCTMWMLKEL